MKEKKRGWIVWLALLIAEAVVAVLIARYQGLAAANTISLNARHLSDGCFVVGMLMTGIGLLTWIATTGFFDMMGYGIRYGVRAFVGLFGGNRKPNDQTFYDYKMEQDEKRGKAQYAILITGVLMIILSILFLAVYYNI